jgi:hypothetical protein
MADPDTTPPAAVVLLRCGTFTPGLFLDLGVCYTITP